MYMANIAIYLHNCNVIATEITSNIDGLICPGEEVVYTCVSQGISQRWRLDNADSSILIEKTYVRGHIATTRTSRSEASIYFYSGQDQLKSTVSALATASIHNTVVECIDITSQHSITIGIAGLVYTINNS